MRILIVDDDSDMQLLLVKRLEKWGHELIVSNNGVQAWQTLQSQTVHFVITDWIMPEMDGVELCKKIRAADFSHYIYIIMLTAKDADAELIKGMEAGADDFIVKPFKREELNVRVKAGERIIALETSLSQKNHELDQAHSIMKTDLEAAGKIQAGLLPKLTRILDIRFDWLFLPSAFIAGDIFNYFRLDETRVGFYLLDVVGHGIPAALLSFTLSNILSPEKGQAGLLKKFIAHPPHYEIASPATVAGNLNREFQHSCDTIQYFTMVYGIIDLQHYKVTITQAAHPHPILLKHDGEISQVGSGGFPVGMLADVEYEQFEVSLDKRDRLILYSDGIVECINKAGEQFSTQRLIDILYEYKDLNGRQMIQKIEKALFQWAGEQKFEDDVTLLIIESP